MKRKRKLSILALCLVCLIACPGCGAGKDAQTAAKAKESKTPEAEENKDIKDLVTIQPADREDTDGKDGGEEDLDAQVDEFLADMSVQEKVAQMFIITPEAATGTDVVTEAGEMTKEALHNIPVGGFVYLEQNLRTPDQVSRMLEAVQEYSMDSIGLPLFTCIDEEGGTVARIGGNPNFNVPYIGNMSELGESGSADDAYRTGQEIGTYLSELGFNVDFAPVADVLSNPDNQVVRYRSFGSDPDLVADMSEAMLDGLEEKGVYGVMKHFPGHGATRGDTHEEPASSDKNLDDLLTCELIPFERGIQAGTRFIMAGHISLPHIVGDGTPASLSYKMLTQLLRNQMDYDGIIITDAMDMGAITQSYSSADAAVKAIQAGADVILMPEDFGSAYQGVLNAINHQTIPTDRIDASVRRILNAKLGL